jgi:predicted acetyltransferase
MRMQPALRGGGPDALLAECGSMDVISTTNTRDVPLMNVVLRAATSADQFMLSNLLQFFLYDLSDVDDRDVDSDGRYTAPPLQAYVARPTADAAFLILADGHIAGFALVGSRSLIDPLFRGHSIDAFLVLRKYRRCGVGRAAAVQLFTMLPGPWELATFATHTVAHAFWRSVLDDFTGGTYHERWLQTGAWRGHIQSFDTTP